ncbi:hypothetical protein KSP40_PGU006522 [Platanthera guangdongensis]|uniref:Uncharacterized protein n=1 Tax=Platanthera guangdongensis TaxID=2320717 RepID=A0ABR2M6F8_9ASPA
MAVRFKFRSSVAFDSIDLDGRLSISVSDLRSKIADRKKLHVCGDFDLVLSDADTGQPFEDEDFQIPAGANVVIKRVPLGRDASNDRRVFPWTVIATNAEKSGGPLIPAPVKRCENFGVDNFDDFGVDVYPNLDAPVRGYDDDINYYNSTVNMKEDTAIRFSEEPNLRCQTITNARLSEALPKEVAGENFRSESDKGENQKENKSEYNGILKNKLSEDKPFQAIVNADLPAELRCSLCSSIFEEAVMIPCCQHSFCNRCIALTLVKQSSCPKCSSSKCTVKDLLPNLSLRQAIEHFLEAQNDINGSYNKLPRYAPDGESGIQTKDVSCAVSVQQQEAACPHSPSATGMGSNHVTSEPACENKFPFKREELCIDAKVGRAVIPPSKLRKFERNCYMCGSPDHLIRECPHSKRENAVVSGMVTPYREGYWHGSTFPNVHYGNLYGGPAMMSFDPMMFQVSPYGISSYLPPMYSNPPTPYGFMRMGAVPPPVISGAEAGTYVESMNNQDGQRKHTNEFQKRYHDFGLSEDYHSAGTRRSHEQLIQADKETSSDNDEPRTHRKHSHHDPHARPSYQEEKGYTADVKHKDPHMSAYGRDRQTHYSDKSKSDLLDASDGSRRHSTERRSHLSKSSKHSGSDCSWKSHRRKPMSDDEFETYPRKFHKELESSNSARNFPRERDSSHSSRRSSKIVKNRDDRADDDDKWKIVKEQETRDRDGRLNQKYRRMP